MSLKSMLLFRRTRGEKLAQSIVPVEEAKDYPCNCCKGRGLIIEKSAFFSVDGENLRNGKGDVITSMAFHPCPACSGIGVDAESYAKLIQGE